MIKKLLKILLFGFLLIPCFSFADFQEFDLGLAEEITANTNLGYTLELENNANFLLDNEYRIIKFAGVGQYSSTWTYFWNGTGMYVAVSCVGGYNCNGTILKQGYFKYLNILDLSYFDGVNNTIPMGQTPVEEYFGNPIYNNPDKLLLGGYGVMQNGGVCFIYSDLDKAVCFSFDRANDSSYLGDSIGLTSQELEYLSSFATVSPFVGSSDNPSYEIGQNYYTNGQIVEGYEYLGLDIGYCYGGFPIDDIFEPNQTIDDFTGYEFGVGATVWDLYDLYSGAYSTPKQFFQQMLQAYMNGQINRFKTEPKALIMFVQQFVSGRDRGRINVGFYDIWDYCNLKFDNVDLNAQYTGNNKTPINGYNQKKVSDSNLGGFQFTGDNAFNIIVGTGGSGNISASEFFGNLTSRFQNGLGTVNTNYIGMIPTYILMFMFALIFIRLISH